MLRRYSLVDPKTEEDVADLEWDVKGSWVRYEDVIELLQKVLQDAQGLDDED